MTFLFSLHRVFIFVGKEVTKWGCALRMTVTAMLAWTASAGLLRPVTCSLQQSHDVIVTKTHIHTNDRMTLIFSTCLWSFTEPNGMGWDKIDQKLCQ